MISHEARATVVKRSGWWCEADIVFESNGREHRMRCFQDATEIHHRLTVARGGDVLDKVNETYHLIHLCHECHSASQGTKEDYEGGMVLQGFVQWDKLRNMPVYTGDNEYLSKKYPNVLA